MKIKNAKRYLSLILALVMAVGVVFPTSLPSYAEENGDITVYVTVSNKGQIQDDKNGLALMNRPMTIPSGSLAISAVKTAHEQFHADGAGSYDEGYNFFSKFWGEVTYNAGYAVNGNTVNNPAEDTISDGDYLDLYIYEDWQSDIYAGFETRFYTVEGGHAVSVELGSRDAFGSDFTPFQGASIYYGTSIPDTDSGRVTDENGQATLYFPNEGTYYLMAQKDGADIIPTVATVIVTGNVDAGAVVASDIESLSFDDIKGENSSPDSVKSNLVLPSIGVSGKSEITWSSNKENSISNSGVVVQQGSEGQDQTVTLTATVTYGDESDSKQMTVTVPKDSRTDAEILDAKLTAVELPTELEAQQYEGDQLKDTNVVDMLKAYLSDGTIAIESTVISSNSAIATNGTIAYGESEIQGEVTFTLRFGTASKTITLPLIVPAKTPSKQEAYDASWLTAQWLIDSNSLYPNTALNNIKSGFELPSEDPEGYYTEISWQSSDEDVVKIASYTTNGNYPITVRRPTVGQDDAQVILTATIEGGIYWDYGMSPPGPMPENAGTKTFEVTVPAVTQEEQAAAQIMLNEAINLYSLDGVTVRGTEKLADLKALTYHINDIPLNWNYVDDHPDFDEQYREIEVLWSTTNPGFKDGKISSGAEVMRTNDDQIGKIILTLNYNGATASTEWDTVIKALTVDGIIDEVAQTLVEIIEDENDGNIVWMLPDIMAYEGASGIEILTEDQQTAALYYLINKAESISSAGDLSKYIIAISSLGYDASDITLENGTKLDLAGKLTAMVDAENSAVKSQYTIGYVILALQQDDKYATDEQMQKLVAWTIEQKDAWQSTSWGTDSMTPIMLALAPYYNSNAEVKAAIEQSLTKLKAYQATQSDGGLGNAASSGLGIAAVAALGIAPDKLENEGSSLTDALISESNYDIKTAKFLPTNNNFATEQGFRGLVAAYGIADDATAEIDTSKSFRLYDFSGITKQPAIENEPGHCLVSFETTPTNATITLKHGEKVIDPVGEYFELTAGQYSYTAQAVGYNTLSGSFEITDEQVSAEIPYTITLSLSISNPTGGGNDDITVKFSLLGIDQHDDERSFIYSENPSYYSEWISEKRYDISEKSTVFELFEQALNTADIEFEGSNGYVSEIDGLSELERGQNSGWLYLLNGTRVEVSMAEQQLKDGDSVIVFFTDNYTAEQGENMGNSGDNSDDDSQVDIGDNETPLTDAPAPFEGKYSDLEPEDWFYEAVKYAYDNGIMGGTSAGEFSPLDTTSRAMVWTMLARMDNAETEGGAMWYSFAQTWAMENEVSGGSNPDESITRQEFVTMLYRYAGSPALTAGQLDFSDAEAVSDWAWDAMVWATAEGIITGKENNTLDPTGTATRAEIATMLMRFMMK